MRVSTTALLLGALSYGCTEGSGPLELREPPVSPPALCTASLPSTLSFGPQPGGSSIVRAVDLGPLDACDLTLTLEDPDDAFEVLESGPMLELRFVPKRPGVHQARLLYLGQTMALEGEGASPRLRAVPPSLDLGSVPLGCTSPPAPLQIFNEESLPIAIDGLRLSGGPAFELAHPAPSILPPQGSLEVSVSVSPNTPERLQTSLLVDISSWSEPVAVAEISALSTPGRATQDSFRQSSPPSLDVLFVVDTGPNMDSVQVKTQSNLQYLFASFDACSTDVRIGVTDANLQGLGGQLTPMGILDASAPDALEQLAASVLLGAETTEPSTPLEAAERALSAPLGDGLWRPQVPQEIYIITNREDRSSDTVQNYLDRFTVMGAREVFVQAIAGDVPDGCALEQGQAEAAPRLLDATTQTRGLFRSVCRDRWWRILDENPICVGIQTSFALNEPAIASTLRVFVDGAPLPSQTEAGTLQWRYIEEDNAIQFAPPSIPEWESQLRVEYQTPFCD